MGEYLLTRRKVHDILPSEKKQASEECAQDSFQATEHPEQPHAFLNNTLPRLLRNYCPWPGSSEGSNLWNQRDCVFLKIVNIRKALKQV